MKRIKINLLLLFFMLVNACLFAQSSVCKKDIQAAESALAARSGNTTSGEAAFTNASDNFTISYSRCRWNIDPAQYFISGNVTHYFTITQPSDSIVFDLYSGLIIDSIYIRSSNLSFTQSSNETLVVQLPSSYSAGQQDSVSIVYHGIPVGNGFGSFVQATHADIPIIWTLSEPYGARDWWPCRNGLDDKINSIDIYVTHPDQYKLSSNGLPMESTAVAPGFVTTHYRHNYPIASYLVAIAVTNFSVFTDHVQLGSINMPVISFVYPEDSAYFHDNTFHMLNAMQLYNEKFVPYAFINERYGQTEFSWGGGMEHQTNSFIINAGQNLMAHELAHQWFGDRVTCASWKDIWLNEGFATFCADFLYAENFDPGSYKSNVVSDLQNIVSSPGGSVLVDDTTDINRIFDGRLSYDKGAFLLRMLRFNLGDSIFFTALKNYLSDPKIQYSFATTADLKKHFEEASDKDLTYFFDQWFSGQGYPSFKLEWSQDDKNVFRGKIDETTSHPSVPFFKVLLPVKCISANTDTTIIVQVDTNHQSFSFNPGVIITSVLIDPQSFIISSGNTVVKVDPPPPPDTLLPQNVYPNPFTSYINFTLPQSKSGKVSIQLFDYLGHRLLSNTINTDGNAHLYQWHIPATLTSGVYLLNVSSDQTSKTYRILRR